MKLYAADAPNPFRVKVFLAEKGVDVPTQKIALMAGETREPPFLEKNSLGELPVLELDDGTVITESVAICRYLEGLYPQPSLMGDTPLRAAKIEMWNRRIERHLMDVIGAVGLHTFPFFAEKIEQQPAYAASQRRLLQEKWRWLDRELSDGRRYLCDDAFSIADITGMATLLICRFAKESVPEGLTHAKRWETAVRARPSWPQ